MANESTTSTINDISISAAIEPYFHSYAMDYVVTQPHLKEFDLRGRGSATIQIPSLATVMGTPGDAGASVDTEFDATEGTTLSNTQRSTNSVTWATSEYGLMTTVTDNVLEDAVSGFDVIGELMNDAARVIVTAFEKDIVDTFDNFSNSVGSSGSNLTLANMSSAITTVRNAGAQNVDGGVFILDMQQGIDYEDALVSTNAAQAVYEGTADQFLSVVRDPNNGMSNGFIGLFRGQPVYITGLTQTRNTAADVQGVYFIRWTPRNDRTCALGKSVSRGIRVETERDASLRGTEIVVTARWGTGELLDAAGCQLVTDA